VEGQEGLAKSATSMRKLLIFIGFDHTIWTSHSNGDATVNAWPFPQLCLAV